jgi:hypothetical protein
VLEYIREITSLKILNDAKRTKSTFRNCMNLYFFANIDQYQDNTQYVLNEKLTFQENQLRLLEKLEKKYLSKEELEEGLKITNKILFSKQYLKKRNYSSSLTL